MFGVTKDSSLQGTAFPSSRLQIEANKEMCYNNTIICYAKHFLLAVIVDAKTSFTYYVNNLNEWNCHFIDLRNTSTL